MAKIQQLTPKKTIQPQHVRVGDIIIGNDLPFILIAGPCVLESLDHALMMSSSLQTICAELGIGLIYKTSFDKANRSSIDSVRGIGLGQSVKIFTAVKKATGLPLLSDYHLPEQAQELAEVVDVLQVPAFLCRQTDLLLAGGMTGKVINVKKGQFLAPEDMGNIVKKIASTGNDNILLTERGVSFGYRTLVNDFRSLPIMAKTGKPIIFDATHSVQSPGGLGDRSGGNREYVAGLARAAIAVGCAGIFMEVHEEPDAAPSDGPNMVPLAKVKGILQQLLAIDNLLKNY